VHRNADASNPAVHVAREGNDVVKRASELTKESSPPAPQEENEAGQSTDAADNNMKDDGVDEEKPAAAAAIGDSGKSAGDKRGRSDTPSDEADAQGKVQEDAEGKEVKKPKLDEKANGQANKAENKERNACAEVVEKNGVENGVEQNSEIVTEKSSHDGKELENASVKSTGSVPEDSPARRTRSKAS
jgi:hypothetical protein